MLTRRNGAGGGGVNSAQSTCNTVTVSSGSRAKSRCTFVTPRTRLAPVATVAVSAVALAVGAAGRVCAAVHRHVTVGAREAAVAHARAVLAAVATRQQSPSHVRQPRRHHTTPMPTQTHRGHKLTHSLGPTQRIITSTLHRPTRTQWSWDHSSWESSTWVR